MTPRERNFFLVAEDRAYLRHACTPEQVAAWVPSYFGYVEPRSRELAEALKRRRYLRFGRGKRLYPTRRGSSRLEPALEEYFRLGGLAKSAKSKAFRSLCFNRQGLDLCQHGSLTSRQLAALTETAAGTGGSHIVDLGCGVGEIGLSIAEEVGADLTGVDTSATALSYARRRAGRAGRIARTARTALPTGAAPQSSHRGVRTAEFIETSMEEVEFLPRSIDLVLAIDALYWIEDLDAFLRRCIEWIRPGGALCIVQSDFAGERGGPQTLPWDDTVVGEALLHVAEQPEDGRELEVHVVDFTDEERRLWRMTPGIRASYEDMFSHEGRLFLLRNLVREAEYLAGSVSKAPGARYLYVARPGSSPA